MLYEVESVKRFVGLRLSGPLPGETTAAIRRRLGAAAELLGKSLVVNRLGDVVYFWEEGEGPELRRRRRKTKTE